MASNQYVNKVEYGGNTLIDLTSDTVNPGVLLTGYTAHNQAGELITGAISDGIPNIGFNNGRFEIELQPGFYRGTMHFENVPIPVPSSGTNSITIKVPNGTTTPSASNNDDWIPITIEVDSSGNSNVTDDTIVATGVSF